MTYAGQPVLQDWRDIEEHWTDESALLLGNGASIAVWPGFSYASLYEEAQKLPDNRLAEVDLGLFQAMETRDFERVLGSLQTTRTVLEALHATFAPLEDYYNRIQAALLDTIVTSHLRKEWISDEVFATLRAAYRQHRAVYTTNYDLLIYWAMQPAEQDFVDHFRGGNDFQFNRAQTAPPWPEATDVLFLHGGIQLRRTPSQGTRKVRWSEGQSLLDQMRIPFSGGETALFVSEGSSAEKERRIHSSDYLSFAFERLEEDSRRLVVVGQKFGNEDAHILRAVKAHGGRPMAVGVRRNDARGKMHGFMERLGREDVTFFDAATHPLTSLAVRVGAPLEA